MKKPELRDALLFDECGKCIGIKDDKGIPADVRAAWDKMLSESADQAWREYRAKLESYAGDPLRVLRIEDEEFAKMVKEESATAEEFNTWRRATSSGLAPLLPSDVATALYGRVESRMKRGVDRTVCPEGMTDLEHAQLVAANCGASGGNAANLAGDEKALHLATIIRKQEPGISTHGLAKRIKATAGSRVTVGFEAVRKKIADWEEAGKIPRRTATPGRNPKRGRKSG